MDEPTLKIRIDGQRVGESRGREEGRKGGEYGGLRDEGVWVLQGLRGLQGFCRGFSGLEFTLKSFVPR